MKTAILARVGEAGRRRVSICLNGVPVECLAGDTVLTAMLLNGTALRRFEFDDAMRAGFCNMGACQDCWVTLEDGRRLRACTTFVEPGMRLII